MPVPVVHFKDHLNDIAMRNHANKAGTAVYRSLGASQVFELPPFPNTHNMGTCRQSEKPRDGVCNKYGQTHDIPNLFISDSSQFTSGGAEKSHPYHRCVSNPASRIFSPPIGQECKRLAEKT
jgi:choline dehydrogenase-like flavoprotein